MIFCLYIVNSNGEINKGKCCNNFTKKKQFTVVFVLFSERYLLKSHKIAEVCKQKLRKYKRTI